MQRGHHSRPYFQWMGYPSPPCLVARDKMGKLEDHVRPDGHLGGLPLRQIESGMHLPRVASDRVSDVKSRGTILIPQLHVPGKPVPFFRPMDTPTIKKMPERHEQLKTQVDSQGRDNHARPSRLRPF